MIIYAILSKEKLHKNICNAFKRKLTYKYIYTFKIKTISENFLKIFHVTSTIYEFTLRYIITKHTQKKQKIKNKLKNF